jgi:hypothetical protein
LLFVLWMADRERLSVENVNKKGTLELKFGDMA